MAAEGVPMPYRLGVDLGTTFTAAAVAADGGAPVMLGLGDRALQVPSVVFLKPDGELLVGEPAERRARSEPGRAAREFKRRIGDPVPIIIAGSPYSPQALSARVLRWVVDKATERMGGPPAEVVLTHPANWGPYKLELLDQVVALADVGPARHLAEPLAAAARYTATTPLKVGERLAVYDLGGGTFDVCVIEQAREGLRVLGAPEGIEHLGGVDFDEALFRSVLDAVGGTERLDQDDPAVADGIGRLRRECVEAKEALSSDADVVVPLAVPGLPTTLRITRAELENLVRPALQETVAAMARALRSAGVEAQELRSIVLIGGSSRIPLVGELLTGEFGVPTAMNTHPKHDVALGAVQDDRAGSAGGADELLAAAPAQGPVPQPARKRGKEPAPQPSPPRAASKPQSPPEDRPRGGPGRQPSKAPTTTPAAGAASSTAGGRARARAGADGAARAPGGPGGPGRRRRTAVLVVVVAALLVGVGVVVREAVQRGGQNGAAVGTPATRSALAPAPTPAATASPSASPSPSPSLAPPPRSAPLLATQLVVPMETDGRSALYLADVDRSSPVRRITKPSENASSPTLSPDLATVAYLADVDESRSRGVIRLAGAADGSSPRDLFRTVPNFCAGTMFRPAWRPNDPTVLAVPCQDGRGRYGIYLVRTDGSLVRKVRIEQERADDPTFSPDGKELAFWAGSAKGFVGGTVWKTDADGTGKPVQLTESVIDGQDTDPIWSPEGDAIAFRRRMKDDTTYGNTEVYVVRPDGSGAKALTSAAADEQDPSWSPTGERIAYRSAVRTSGWKGKTVARIWIMKADGSGKRVLWPDAEGEQGPPAWSRR